MAQYKVPQDVEAEDKLLGPFTFRQFIYLLIAAAGIAGAWGLFQIFPLLGLIPLPFVFFFGILALPIRKDQPMETYLAALVGFYLKPNRRVWKPGQRESTIKIIAPKKVEKSRVRDLSEDEASHRLSFLADIVDTEGYAIRGDNSTMRDEYAAEADTVQDVLEADNPVIDQIIQQEQTTRKMELVSQMRTAMERTDALVSEPTVQQLTQASLNQATVNRQMTNLANNKNFSVQTIAQQANRIQQQAQQPVPQPTQSMPQPAQVMPTAPQNMPQPVQTMPQPAQNPFNNMMPPAVAGTPPVFQPMSVPLPDLPEPGHRYNQPDKPETSSNPDLYGPPAAIFSS